MHGGILSDLDIKGNPYSCIPGSPMAAAAGSGRVFDHDHPLRVRRNFVLAIRQIGD
jgi:hypothetical protein